jgi:hypothetical protein
MFRFARRGYRREQRFSDPDLLSDGATAIEASMIEGWHFRDVEARRRTIAEAIDRYIDE